MASVAGQPLTLERPSGETALLVAVAVALQAIVWALLVYLLYVHRVFYGFHDMSDTVIYLDYATKIAGGLRPYADFPVEYPPLALALLVIPSHVTQAAYDFGFSAEMIVLCTAAGALTAWAAARLWQGLGRPLAVAAAYAVAVLAAGAIIANRYDAAVALSLAAFVFFLTRRRYALAGGALGVGFALKLTPVMLLPLALLMARKQRPVLTAVAAFAVLAVLPFLPFVGDVHGLSNIVTYHAQRPLQIESVPATPFVLAGALGSGAVTTGNSFGSQFVAATGTGMIARLSVWVGLLAVIGVYALIWRRRDLLRAAPRYLPLAAFACIIVFTVCNKVLSPQFLVWTLPLVALVVVGDGLLQRASGVLTLLAIALTQVEFPVHYWSVLALDTGPVLLVAVRNVVLVGAAVSAVLALWFLPERATSAAP